MLTLDWAPSTYLREGLLKTVKYFDSLLTVGRADARSASPASGSHWPQPSPEALAHTEARRRTNSNSEAD